MEKIVKHQMNKELQIESLRRGWTTTTRKRTEKDKDTKEEDSTQVSIIAYIDELKRKQKSKFEEFGAIIGKAI